MPSSALPRTPSSTLFPYTTLFRSEHFAPPVLTKSNHSFFQGPMANGGCTHSLHAIVADPIRRDHQLENAAATPVPALMTFATARALDRKSTRLNSSHRCISYAVFCFTAHPELYTLSLHDALPI